MGGGGGGGGGMESSESLNDMIDILSNIFFFESIVFCCNDYSYNLMITLSPRPNTQYYNTPQSPTPSSFQQTEVYI